MVYMLCLLVNFLRLNSATITENKYKVVTKTLIQNHAASFLSSSTWKTKLGCATACDNSDCLSFSYNSATRECKTYRDEICHRDDGVTSSTVSFYVKNTILEDLNHCGEVPSVYCSAVYTVNPSQYGAFDVYCDMDTAGGPWTIVTNRYDGTVNFYESWDKYKNGFGSLTGEYWLGFEKYRILQTQNLKMRIEMGGWDGSLKYVEYTSLIVSSESSDYSLWYTGFSTPHGLGDKLDEAINMPFTTYNRDNDDNDDGNCADSATGAWWYGNCYSSNLFGQRVNADGYQAMVWKYFYPDGGEYSALKSVRMMLAKP
ncbi:fibrinogen-like protein A [Pecten maximus]|uniref:fibrinogen-like protein A n=1 Tax=Pecten maximus TaxID=6579 RepID=UPI00145825A3|nr:fibrinogen-like protein A [Pecten maximus]